MTKETIDGAGAFGRIRAFIRKKYGTQRKCARALGISEGHLSDMLNARCELSPVLLAAAGLVRRVVYEVKELPEMVQDNSGAGKTVSSSMRSRPTCIPTAPMLPRTGLLANAASSYRIGLTAEATALGLNRPGMLMRPPSQSWLERGRSGSRCP